MIDQMTAYITFDWLEQGPLDSITGQRLWRKGRKVCTPMEYPQRLLCGNPKCEDGGFEISDRIAALLASGIDSEQNSLICTNAMPEDRAKRCLHTILYSIVCIYPYRRGTAREIRLTTSGQKTS
jgi:hypothetical protein